MSRGPAPTGEEAEMGLIPGYGDEDNPESGLNNAALQARVDDWCGLSLLAAQRALFQASWFHCGICHPAGEGETGDGASKKEVWIKLHGSASRHPAIMGSALPATTALAAPGLPYLGCVVTEATIDISHKAPGSGSRWARGRCADRGIPGRWIEIPVAVSTALRWSGDLAVARGRRWTRCGRRPARKVARHRTRLSSPRPAGSSWRIMEIMKGEGPDASGSMPQAARHVAVAAMWPPRRHRTGRRSARLQGTEKPRA